MTWVAAYALAGALVGFLAGLLGIGGGMTLVPVLAAMFSAQAGSVLTAPAGARAAHRLPVIALKRVFACLLYVLATRMALAYW